MALAILYGWPYIGLFLAVGIALYLEQARQQARQPLHAPAYVLGWVGPIYLLHQFEAHGVDLLGRPYAFLQALCDRLGFTVAACPADAVFIFAVNPGACWIAIGLALWFRERHPTVAAMAWGIPLVNALAHVGAALQAGAYNPGLATSVVLFVPAGGWMLWSLHRDGQLSVRTVALIIGTGVVVHAVLLGSLQLSAAGVLSAGALYLVNALNGLWPAMGLRVSSEREARPKSAAETAEPVAPP